MGMFDEVIWENAPAEDRKDGPYQTKSLDCDLVTYTITSDGQLMHHGKKCAFFTGILNFYYPEYFATVVKGNVIEIKDDHGNVIESHPIIPVTCPNCGHVLED